jgi:hypothetical protein
MSRPIEPSLFPAVSPDRALGLGGAPGQGLESDERYTPAWVFDGLGLVFDLDVAAPVAGGDVVPARARYTVADDGLAQPWYGAVWCNPPFSDSTPWAERFIEHRCGVFLGPVANARWTHEMLAAADLIWLCRDFAFTHPTHNGRRSSMPLFFAAFDSEPVAALRRLAGAGVHDGVLVQRVEP